MPLFSKKKTEDVTNYKARIERQLYLVCCVLLYFLSNTTKFNSKIHRQRKTPSQPLIYQTATSKLLRLERMFFAKCLERLR